MSQTSHATLEHHVLLATVKLESMHFLHIILEGFGYIPEKCQNLQQVRDALGRCVPQIAFVHQRLDETALIYSAIKETGSIPVILFVDSAEKDPQACCDALGADFWLLDTASPEAILSSMKTQIKAENQVHDKEQVVASKEST
jgi:hypothetical protein